MSEDWFISLCLERPSRSRVPSTTLRDPAPRPIPSRPCPAALLPSCMPPRCALCSYYLLLLAFISSCAIILTSTVIILLVTSFFHSHKTHEQKRKCGREDERGRP
ncbi:hypothetical protein E2C01_097945 [Portunus trituberculatus]|uniref:Uncharacterized protein n=1 Tax=Portunus trituberculatus TaxID=210409 RepID=A0A5B7K675_PORTR|nr:hypothetical protein [Portunus trituberculatus]